MPFTVKEFPGQLFKSVDEWEDAKKRRQKVEDPMTERPDNITRVTATVIPASKELLEKKLAGLERKILELTSKVEAISSNPEPIAEDNKENIPIGTVLKGESGGQKYTLEVLDEGYLCSDGNIYQSLSGAALGVSGNRRSGWRFWKNVKDKSIGEMVGRFSADNTTNPFELP